MKQFKDFHTFKKAVRKYWKRYAKKSYFYHNGKRMISWWTSSIWCCYIVNNYEELKQKNIRNWFQYDIDPDMIDNFIENYKDLFGKNIIGMNIFSKKDEVKGEFIGFALVNNGVLYAIKNGKEIELYRFNIKIRKEENS